jgi:hypothetical protein
MRARSSTYVGIAVFPLAVLAVHHLRYLIAYGADATGALQAQGHAYLGAMAPLIVVTFASAVGGFLGKLAEHWKGAEAERAVRTRRLWLAATLALVAVYAGQESLEGLLASGHPGGLTGIFGNGGWWAIPAAAAFGGGLSLLMRGGQRLVHAVAAARVRSARPALPRPLVFATQLASVALAPAAPLARRGAGRAPPALAHLQ